VTDWCPVSIEDLGTGGQSTVGHGAHYYRLGGTDHSSLSTPLAKRGLSSVV